MRLSPPEPSFLDMRNAILLAHDGDDTDVWQVFQDRGMGYFASTDGSSDIAPDRRRQRAAAERSSWAP